MTTIENYAFESRCSLKSCATLLVLATLSILNYSCVSDSVLYNHGIAEQTPSHISEPPLQLSDTSDYPTSDGSGYSTSSSSLSPSRLSVTPTKAGRPLGNELTTLAKAGSTVQLKRTMSDYKAPQSLVDASLESVQALTGRPLTTLMNTLSITNQQLCRALQGDRSSTPNTPRASRGALTRSHTRKSSEYRLALFSPNKRRSSSPRASSKAEVTAITYFCAQVCCLAAMSTEQRNGCMQQDHDLLNKISHSAEVSEKLPDSLKEQFNHAIARLKAHVDTKSYVEASLKAPKDKAALQKARMAIRANDTLHSTLRKRWLTSLLYIVNNRRQQHLHAEATEAIRDVLITNALPDAKTYSRVFKSLQKHISRVDVKQQEVRLEALCAILARLHEEVTQANELLSGVSMSEIGPRAVPPKAQAGVTKEILKNYKLDLAHLYASLGSMLRKCEFSSGVASGIYATYQAAAVIERDHVHTVNKKKREKLRMRKLPSGWKVLEKHATEQGAEGALEAIRMLASVYPTAACERLDTLMRKERDAREDDPKTALPILKTTVAILEAERVRGSQIEKAYHHCLGLLKACQEKKTANKPGSLLSSSGADEELIVAAKELLAVIKAAKHYQERHAHEAHKQEKLEGYINEILKHTAGLLSSNYSWNMHNQVVGMLTEMAQTFPEYAETSVLPLLQEAAGKSEYTNIALANSFRVLTDEEVPGIALATLPTLLKFLEDEKATKSVLTPTLEAVTTVLSNSNNVFGIDFNTSQRLCKTLVELRGHSNLKVREAAILAIYTLLDVVCISDYEASEQAQRENGIRQLKQVLVPRHDDSQGIEEIIRKVAADLGGMDDDEGNKNMPVMGPDVGEFQIGELPQSCGRRCAG